MRIRKHGGLVDVDKNGKVIITPFAGQQVDITGDVDISGTLTKDGVAILAGLDAMVYKGAIDCSANPNYPAADAGDTYRVSVAGKIGGASGAVVEAGDILICNTDGTLAGTQAQRGTAWNIIQANIDGAVVGPVSATADAFTQFDGTTGKLVKSGVTLDTDAALAGDSDIRLASQKAVKAYADTKQAALTNPVVGVGASYKVARGVAAITGSGDVVTGLTTVVSVTVTARDDLDGDTLAGVSATIGDQAGAPAAGSVTIKTWKVTTGGASGNPTLIAATAAKNVNWIAVGL